MLLAAAAANTSHHTLRASLDKRPKKETRNPYQARSQKHQQKELALGGDQNQPSLWGDPTARGRPHCEGTHEQPSRPSGNRLFPSSLRIESPGLPQTRTPLQTAARESGPREAGPRRGQKGPGRGFPSNLTWAAPPHWLTGAVLPGPAEPQPLTPGWDIPRLEPWLTRAGGAAVPDEGSPAKLGPLVAPRRNS